MILRWGGFAHSLIQVRVVIGVCLVKVSDRQTRTVRLRGQIVPKQLES